MIKILIIEDKKDDFYSITRFLKEENEADYEINWCCDFKLAEEEILMETHDVYLIDYFFGKKEGLAIVERLRERNFRKPIILLTGNCSKDIEAKAIALGASDFLIKEEIKPEMLERSIRYALDRYKQQQFIREQEQKYRNLFELSVEPFLILNENFQIIEFNSSFLDVFDQLKPSNEQVNNLQFSELFKSQEEYNSLKQHLEVEQAVKGFKTILLNYDRDVVASISIAALPKSQLSDKDFYHVAISDLTKIMEQEQELKRTEKHSMSGRMARMIAHEIRNPLTNIRLALGELESITSNDDAVMLNQMIERNTSRISTLIDDLIKSARPQELTKESVDLRMVVAESLMLCQDRIELLNIHLKKNICDSPIIGEWDKEKLKIAFTNIITNAIEAMEEVSTPVLTIIVNCFDDIPTVYIRDNGKGMDEETLANLFDPFFSNRKNGLGLGMTATLNIINMHEGKIYVRSELGKGTEFRVEI
ncbi:MAG: response regulator [Brumimicrobium sp.]|nr:response regulator [Brumimicrobium sp.]